MPIILKHPFVNKLPNVDELFLTTTDIGCVCSINSYCDKIKTLSEKYANIIDENLFKGDALEIFVEYMLRTDGTDNRIGIFDPKIISETGNDDVGVDMVGIGANGFPATVQVKYRAGNYVLTANEDHLSNFLTSSWVDYSVRMEDDKNMLIVTTGMKVDENTIQKMLKAKVRVLNRESLRQMFDNRPEWWKRFYESVRDSRVKIKDKTPPRPLREHQKEAVEAAFKDSNNKGMVILPTGTGKTMIESEIICQFLIQSLTKSRKEFGINSENSFSDFPPIIKMNSSRILLCFQLFDDVLERMNAHGIQARWVNFNSGDKDDVDYAIAMRQEGWQYREVLSTTNPKEVKEIYEQCKKDKMPLVVISTYHSAERFSSSELIPDLTVHDEAHNLVSDNFHVCATLTNHHNYFFTATTKTCGYFDGIGMDNPKIFDDIIYSKSATELIKAGEIAPPHLHIVRAKNRNYIDTDYEAMVKSVFEAFEKHSEKINELSYNKSEMGAKVLVICRGQLDLMEMFKTKAFSEYRVTNPDVHFFALSSEFGIYNDGEKLEPPVTNMKKYAVLKRLKALKNSDKAIIFHVDMIGEGIDVAGITGVMPFRNCSLTKLVQNIGRSMRLHKMDRHEIYKGNVSVEDRSKWIKPYSWVIIPSYMVDTDGIEFRIKDIVKSIRDEFGYIPNQIDIVEDSNGIEDPIDPDPDNEVEKKKPQIKSNIDDFEHEFEGLCPIEKILMEEKVEEKRKQIVSTFESLGFKKVVKTIDPPKFKKIQQVQEVVGDIETAFSDSDFDIVSNKLTKEGFVIYKKKSAGRGRRTEYVKVDNKFIPLRDVKNGKVG